MARMHVSLTSKGTLNVGVRGKIAGINVGVSKSVKLTGSKSKKVSGGVKPAEVPKLV